MKMSEDMEEKLLKELEIDLKDRYTDLDEDYSRLVDEEFRHPPVVKLSSFKDRSYYQQDNFGRNNRNNYHGRSYNDRGDRYNPYSNSNRNSNNQYRRHQNNNNYNNNRNNNRDSYNSYNNNNYQRN